MRKKYIPALLLLLSLPLIISAQEVRDSYVGEMRVSHHLFAHKGDSVIIDMSLDLNGARVGTTRELELTPVLVSDKEEMALPPVLKRGARRTREARRSYSLMNERGRASLKPYYAVVSGRSIPPFRYRVSVPYEAWMSDARLVLRESVSSCCGAWSASGSGVLRKEMLESYSVRPVVAYVIPEVESVKARSEHFEAYLDFPVGKSVLDPSFRNNAMELSKIRKELGNIMGDNYSKVTSVEVTGYASPEGRSDLNRKLSADRARSLVEYFRSNYPLPREAYRFEGAGEDWKTLAALVDSSFLPDRDFLLTVILDASSDDKKEARMRSHDGGRLYKTLKESYFPKLRRSEIRLGYSVRGLTVEEGRSLINDRPFMLSLNEMYLVANSYTKGSPEFDRVFETAVSSYPDNAVANVNMAAAMIGRGDLDSAESYLSKGGDLAAGYNNLGVIAMMRGEWDKASEYLGEASRRGSQEAVSNLEELHRKTESERVLGNM